MAITTYADLNAQFTQAYDERDFATALDLLTREGPRFPTEASTIFYLRSCMAARLAAPDAAIRILAEAIDRGFWYGQLLLRNSPSWQPLQGIPAFEHLAAICLARQAEAQRGATHMVAEPQSGIAPGKTYPLLLALHGNAQNGASALAGWQAITSMGWMLVAIQSSQAEAQDAYVWDDQTIARRDITDQLQEILATYPIDQNHIVLAGFSMGGETALRLALEGALPTRRFLLLGPGGPTIDEPDAWNPLIAAAVHRELRGYILVGEHDAGIPQDAVREIAERLVAQGIPCRLELLPGLRHEYPDDQGAALTRALDFLHAGKD